MEKLIKVLIAIRSLRLFSNMSQSSGRRINSDIWIFGCYSMAAFFSLLVGVGIYVLFRQDTLIAYFFLEKIGISKIVTPEFTSEINGYLYDKSPMLLFLAKNYISDFCWAYSLEICLAFALRRETKQLSKSGFISMVFLAILETVQVFEFIPGTFDLFDIVCEILALVCALVTIYIYRTLTLFDSYRNQMSR